MILLFSETLGGTDTGRLVMQSLLIAKWPNVAGIPYLCP